MLTGVGLAAMTKDKVEELAKELAEKGEMSEKEGKELVDELMKKSERARKDLEAKVEEIVQKMLEKMNMATKEDIKRFEKKIRHIEQERASDKKRDTAK